MHNRLWIIIPLVAWIGQGVLGLAEILPEPRVSGQVPTGDLSLPRIIKDTCKLLCLCHSPRLKRPSSWLPKSWSNAPFGVRADCSGRGRARYSSPATPGPAGTSNPSRVRGDCLGAGRASHLVAARHPGGLTISGSGGGACPQPQAALHVRCALR